MSTIENQEVETTPEVVDGEGNTEETISLSKSEYEKLNQTLGSYKRELKDLKKAREEVKEPETPQKNQPDNSDLLQKTYLRAAGINASDEVEFTLAKAKKWGVSVDSIVDDEDFREQLDKFRTKKANELATSNIKGGRGTGEAKNTPEYWIAKGQPPTPADVPDRKTRAKIARAMMSNTKSSKTFYND